MKLNKILLSFTCVLMFLYKPVSAQQEELEQLALNIQKLNQLRSILNNMYRGYKILTAGYNNIKDLTEGNFSLHKAFLDGLLMVSPAVKKYRKAAEIIVLQRQLLKEYKIDLTYFKTVGVFSTSERNYFEKVYDNLVGQALRNLDELLMVLTAGQLRMNDAERLSAIDHIYANMQDKIQFLRHFNDKTALIASQRRKSKKDIEDVRSFYGIKK